MIPDGWMNQGLCRTSGVNPDWFYPEGYDRQSAIAAKLVCQSCPVVTQCLAFALDNMDVWECGREGIWGGTTKEERLRLAGRRNPSGKRGRPKSRVA